jgi:AraC-like DNA-binding protein
MEHSPDVETALQVMLKNLRIIIGPDFRADRICFAHAAPGDLSPYRRLALTSYLALLRENSSDDLLTQLDYMIQRQLRSGPCTLQLVAEELRMHPRNLQQQLKSMGTGFSEALAAYRSRHAMTLLNDPALQINQIALRLGYCDATAFGQAFKKWFGKTPSEYRKQACSST